MPVTMSRSSFPATVDEDGLSVTDGELHYVRCVELDDVTENDSLDGECGCLPVSNQNDLTKNPPIERAQIRPPNDKPGECSVSDLPRVNHTDLTCTVLDENPSNTLEPLLSCTSRVGDARRSSSSSCDSKLDSSEGSIKTDDPGGAAVRYTSWRWVAVAGCTINNILTGGLVMAFSIIFIELQSRYDISAQAAGWVYSISMISFMLSGPLCVELCSRYSCRQVAGVCGLMLTCSVLVLGYAPSVGYIYIGYSVLGGVSNGMLTLVNILMIGERFDRKRGAATGVVMAGKNIGQMVYGPLLSWLFYRYGYQGCLLITSALTLNTCVAAALFGSKSEVRSYKPEVQCPEDTSGGNNRSRDDEVTIRDTRREEFVKENDPTRRESTFLTKTDDPISETSENQQKTPNVAVTNPTRMVMMNSIRSVFRKLSNKLLNSQTDVTLFKEPLFLFYGLLLPISVSTCASLYNACVAGIVQEHGFGREQMALLLLVSGIVGCVAKSIGGLIFDISAFIPYRAHVFMGGCMVWAGIVFSVPFLRDSAQIFSVLSVYAVISSAVGSQTSVVTVDILGAKRQPSALGLSMPFRGIGILLGPPLGGYLRDITGSFDVSLHTCGAMFFTVAVIVEFVIVIKRKSLDINKTK